MSPYPIGTLLPQELQTARLPHHWRREMVFKSRIPPLLLFLSSSKGDASSAEETLKHLELAAARKYAEQLSTYISLVAADRAQLCKS